MELIEYYRIIRRRLWVPLALAVFGLLAVSLLFVFGPQRWRSEGQMLAQPGAAMRVQWTGTNVEVVEEADAWGTLQQLVESRAVATAAAREAGLIPPDGSTAALQALAFERAKRGAMFMVRGNGPSPDAADRYVDAAMQQLSEIWNQTRLERTRAMAADLRRQLEVQEPARQAVLRQVEQAESGSPPGKPTDLLAWMQTQITENQGALSAAQVDTNVARDRLTALQSLARRERNLPLEQRTWVEGGNVTTPSAALEARIADLETQRVRMLQTRTEHHPEVEALTQDLANARRQLQAEKERTERSRNGVSPGLSQQIVMSRMELASALRRIQALQARDNALRNRLPALQNRARHYTEIVERLKPLDEQREAVLGNLRTLDAEARRLRDSRDLSVVDKATIISSNRSPSRFAILAVAAIAAGFIIGILVVFLLHYLDVSGQSKEPGPAPA